MIDFAALRERKYIDTSEYPRHEIVSFNMEKDCISQKEGFIGLENALTSTKDVVQVHNFEDIRNREELIQAVLNRTEQARYIDADEIIFRN